MTAWGVTMGTDDDSRAALLANGAALAKVILGKNDAKTQHAKKAKATWALRLDAAVILPCTKDVPFIIGVLN